MTQIKRIQGADFGKMQDWLKIARELQEAAETKQGASAEQGYRELLREYGEAFEQIDQYEEGIAALLFNSPAAFFPQELRTAAEWINGGTSLDEAHETLTAQAELARVHCKHTLWRDGHPDGIRADFTGREMKNLDFTGMTFNEANFTNTDLYNCWMNGASFVQCDFSGADFLYASAIGADFEDAIFDGASLMKSDFHGANLEGTSFAGATLTACDFTDADIETVDFTQAEIQNCVGLGDISSSPAMSM